MSLRQVFHLFDFGAESLNQTLAVFLMQLNNPVVAD